MTHFLTQSELESLSDAELHLKLSQIYNHLTRSQGFAQSCLMARATAENIETALRFRRLQGRRP